MTKMSVTLGAGVAVKGLDLEDAVRLSKMLDAKNIRPGSKRTYRVYLKTGVVEDMTLEDIAHLAQLLNQDDLEPGAGNVRMFNSSGRTVEGTLDQLAYLIWVTTRGPAGSATIHTRYDSDKRQLVAIADGKQFWSHTVESRLPKEVQPFFGVNRNQLRIPPELWLQLIGAPNGQHKADAPAKAEAVAEPNKAETD